MFEKASGRTRKNSMIPFLLFKQPAYKGPYLYTHCASRRINIPTVNSGYCLGSWSERAFISLPTLAFPFFVTMSRYNFVINHIQGANATLGLRTTFHPPGLSLNTQAIQPHRQVGLAQGQCPSQTGLCFLYRREQSSSLSSELM